MMSSVIISLITIAITIANVHGYSRGADPSACDSMVPGHGPIAQSGHSNYTIDLSSTNYACGNNITVTLGGASFRGFFCQARSSVNNGSSKVGTFDIGGRTGVQLRCDNKGVTHTDSDDKMDMVFTWGHAENSGNVSIVCTWVKQKSTFWTKEQSAMLTYHEGSCTTTTVGARNGTTTVDAGTTTVDAGTTTVGARNGTTTVDAGTTTVDAGTTTVDAGTTTVDAGTTTVGAGTGTTTAGAGTGTTTAGDGTGTTTAGAGTGNGNGAGHVAVFLILSYIITI